MELGFTDFFKNEILRQYFTENVELYVGLFVTTGPSEFQVEISNEDTSYARQPVAFKTVNASTVVNTNEVLFKAEEDWTTDLSRVTHIGIFNTPNIDKTEGLLVYLPLTTDETIMAGQSFVLNTNSIKVQLV